MRVTGRLLLLGIVGLIFICGCTTEHTITRQPSLQQMRNTQLIIKFRNDGFDPSPAVFVQELSRHAHAELAYLRPLTGGAHVFRVENISDTARLAEIIQRLAQRADILYVEPDRIMQHQREKQ
jgi:hypothetical protein